MKPADVVLAIPCPLAGCFRKAEAERAAALLVRALAELGNEWRPITWGDAQSVWRRDLAAGVDPVATILGSSLAIVQPDVYALIDGGFVTAPVVDGKTSGPFEFTPAALELMRERWTPPEKREGL